MSRAAIGILSTENLLHNIAVIKERAPRSRIIAMIKANAYGHGLRSTAQRLERHVDSLGVASIDEALALRKIGIKSNITLMEGVFERDELMLASSENLQVVFHSEHQIEWLESCDLPAPLHVWIKIDTGMGRLGFALHQAQAMPPRLDNNPKVVHPIGVMSHFACADELDHPLNKLQINAFEPLAKEFPGAKSFSNSAGVFHFPECAFDVVRPGLAMYGISPITDKTAAELLLKPVMTLQTKLIAVKHMKKGASLGYGSRYICPQDMPVGVMAIGYGDGYPRTAKDGAPVLLNNKKCAVIGRVSMDMTTIDLRPCPDAKVGDSVTLWGEGLPIEEFATHTSNIAYDLLCAVQSRVKFNWTPYETDCTR